MLGKYLKPASILMSKLVETPERSEPTNESCQCKHVAHKHDERARVGMPDECAANDQPGENPDAIQIGDDQKLYIGTIPAPDTSVEIDASDAPDTDLDGTATLTEIPLTQDNYLTWQEGDNFGRSTVTIEPGVHLFVGMDVGDMGQTVNPFQGFASLATVEIRAVIEGSPGDFDADGDVDGADFMLWQQDASIGSLSDWQTYFGATSAVAVTTAVPEPSGAAMVLVAVMVGAASRRDRRSYA